MKRGVVLSPDFTHLPNGSVHFKSAVDQAELRKYLLYWDKIEVPLTTMVLFECEEFDFLADVGVLQRTVYSKSNMRFMHIRDSSNMTLPKMAGDEILEGHEAIFSILNKDEPGQWSKAQLGSSPVCKDGEQKIGMEISLYEMLPVPSEETSLNDIIEFKSKRQDELIAFRSHLDDIYQKVLSAPDFDRARVTEVTRLQQSIDALYKTMAESKIKTLFTSLKSTVGGMDGIVGAVAGAAAAPYVSLSPNVAGATAAGLVIAAKMYAQSAAANKGELTFLKSLKKQGLV